MCVVEHPLTDTYINLVPVVIVGNIRQADGYFADLRFTCHWKN